MAFTASSSLNAVGEREAVSGETGVHLPLPFARVASPLNHPDRVSIQHGN
jgi:hypothetical protein